MLVDEKVKTSKRFFFFLQKQVFVSLTTIEIPSTTYTIVCATTPSCTHTHAHTCENRFRSNGPCVVLLNEIQSFILFLSSTALTFFLIFYRAFRTQQHGKLYIERIYLYMYTYVHSYKCIRRYIPTAYDNKLLDLFITIQVE